MLRAQWMAAGGELSFPVSPDFIPAVPSIFLSLEFIFWRNNIFGARLTSLLLHALVGWAFYLLLRKWRLSHRLSLTAAIIFLIHPLATGTLENIFARGEQTGTICALLAMILFSAYLQSRRRRRTRLWLAAGFFLLALFSSAVFFSLPLFILLFPYFRGEEGVKNVYGNNYPRSPKILFCPAALISLAVFFCFYLPARGIGGEGAGSLRCWWGWRDFVRSLRLLFLPVGLSIYHPPPSSVFSVLPALAVATVPVFLLSVRRRSSLFFSSAAWISLSLLSPLLFPAPLEESSLYFAAAGASLFLAVLIDTTVAAPGKSRRFFAPLLLSCLLVSFLCLGRRRHTDWSSDLSLWESAARQYPRSPLIQARVGEFLLKDDRPAKALLYCNRAAEIAPTLPRLATLIGDVHEALNRGETALDYYRRGARNHPSAAVVNLKTGLYYDRRGYPRLARRYYRQRPGIDHIPLDPIDRLEAYRTILTIAAGEEGRGDYNGARETLGRAGRIYPFSAEPSFRRALIRLRQKLPQKALAELEDAEQKEGVTAQILFYRGKAYRGIQQYRKALQSFHRALKLNPRYRDAYIELGTLLVSYRKYDLAERAFRQALELAPDDERVHTNLGNIHRFRNQPDEAVREYRHSIRLRDNFTARYNLAMLLMERGDHQRAFPHLHRALRMTEDPDFHSKIKAAIGRLEPQHSNTP